MSKRVRFKSTPENWRKEYLGLKTNTLRKKDDNVRFQILNDFVIGKWNIIDIEIENTKTTEVFVRRVTDVTRYEGFYIISWGMKLNSDGVQ